MKIIHTADWHLGQNFYRYDREEEHRSFFSQLADYMAEHRPDALVVSGDVFHNAAPPIAALRLFVDGVMQLHDASPETTIVITAGNHDSGNRLDADRELWRRLNVHVVGSCRRNEEGTFDPAQFIVEIPGRGYVVAVPYFHPANYPLAATDTDRESRQAEFFRRVLGEVVGSGLPVVMMAHLAVAGSDMSSHDDPVGGMYKEEISTLGEGYDYLALGHIHMPQRLTPRAFYSGSPLPVSFSEDYPHYVNLVEVGVRGDVPKVKQLEIKQLRRVVTLPEAGLPFEEALWLLADYNQADNSYVRLLVDQEGLLPPDAEDRARRAVADKQCRFCEVHRVIHPIVNSEVATIDVADVSTLSKIDPIEIAVLSFERAHNQAMPDHLRRMFESAIQSITVNED